jgi:sulfate transport system substrate-binding protein
MRRISISLALAFFATAIAACGGGGSSGGDGAGSSDGGSVKLSLVAYSTPREAYEELIPLFQKTDAGAGVTFDQSYGSSGEQSRAVEDGLPADVVAFSLEPDVTRLVDAGIVAKDWASRPFSGMVTDSVVVFVVRKGNPKGIRTWDDLVRDDVEVLTPNPFTSGGARWNLMAAYGAELRQGKSRDAALDYLRRLLANVSVQDKSARESLQTFSSGKGDVLLAYENEAIFAQAGGQDVDYVVPAETILIENPAAVTTGSEHPAEAGAFLDFLVTPEAQRVFAQKGYRPVDADVAREFDFPRPPGLFTIADLGGWEAVTKDFFDRESGAVAKIERDLGVSTAAS